MSEKVLTDADGRPYTGQDVLYREKGATALDVQRAADALLRRGQKPSIAAVREELGGGSPNTLAPLLEHYWKGLGTRLPAGPESLQRVPESLARITEALWLRSLDEARERAKASLIGASPSQREVAALQGKVTELTAALAESRARSSELEAQILTCLRDRMELREQVQHLMALLKAEQEMRAQTLTTADAIRKELSGRRAEVLTLRRRKLANPVDGGRVYPRSKRMATLQPRKSKSTRLSPATVGKRRPVKTAEGKRGRRRVTGK